MGLFFAYYGLGNFSEAVQHGRRAASLYRVQWINNTLTPLGRQVIATMQTQLPVAESMVSISNYRQQYEQAMEKTQFQHAAQYARSLLRQAQQVAKRLPGPDGQMILAEATIAQEMIPYAKAATALNRIVENEIATAALSHPPDKDAVDRASQYAAVMLQQAKKIQPLQDKLPAVPIRDLRGEDWLPQTILEEAQAAVNQVALFQEMLAFIRGVTERDTEVIRRSGQGLIALSKEESFQTTPSLEALGISVQAMAALLEMDFVKASDLFEKAISIARTSLRKSSHPDNQSCAAQLLSMTPVFLPMLSTRISQKRLLADMIQLAEDMDEYDNITRADLYAAAMAYQKAAELYLEEYNSLAGRKRTAAEDRLVLDLKVRLSTMYVYQGRLEDTADFRRTIVADVKRGAFRGNSAGWYDDSPVPELIDAYIKASRLNEAETLVRAVLAGNPEDFSAHNQLAEIQLLQGRNVEALRQEELGMQRALSIFQGRTGSAVLELFRKNRSLMLNSNVTENTDQRIDAAQSLISIAEQMFGAHSRFAREARSFLAAGIARCGDQTGAQRELTKLRNDIGQVSKDDLSAATHFNIGSVCLELDDYAEATEAFRKAVDAASDGVCQSLFGEHIPVDVARIALAESLIRQGKFSGAEKLMTQNPAGSADRVDERFAYNVLLAEMHWRAGDGDAARSDIIQAVGVLQQGDLEGGQFDLDQAFNQAGLARDLQQILYMQYGDSGTEGLTDMETVLAAMELSRAQVLLRQIANLGRATDLYQDSSVPEIKQLRSKLEEAETKYTRLLQHSRDSAEIEGAQLDVLAARAALHNSAPAAARTRKNVRPASLAELRDVLARENGWALSYFVGEKASYLQVIPPDGAADARLFALEIPEKADQVFGVGSGPLTARRMASVLHTSDGSGLLDELTDQAAAETQAGRLSLRQVEQLALLWEILVPDAELRRLIVDRESGTIERLYIFPSGPLVQLPFEMLITNHSPALQGEYEYLLDSGPLLQYCPAATFLVHYSQELPPQLWSVLTTGVYDYRGRNINLPNTVNSTAWIESELANQQATSVTRLFGNSGEQATEAAVRGAVPGKTILHFACHGSANATSLANSFGRLELYPTDSVDPKNDGYLELHELCELDMSDCHLAILSACQSNAGTNLVGEGVRSLSNAFLAAGARRTVATQWVVNDAAASTLVYNLVWFLNDERKTGAPMDVAEALRHAKLNIRQGGNDGSSPRWAHPFYWAPFVLTGP